MFIVWFSFTEPGICRHTRFFFSAHKNGQLTDHEEIFVKLDKKCIGLELPTMPFASTLKSTEINYSTNKMGGI